MLSWKHLLIGSPPQHATHFKQLNKDYNKAFIFHNNDDLQLLKSPLIFFFTVKIVANEYNLTESTLNTGHKL